MENFADTISGFVQYNNDNNKYFPFNVQTLCTKLVSDDFQVTFPKFFLEWDAFSQQFCTPTSYDSNLADLNNVDPKAPTASGRAWFWQTCTEFGYYQTSSDSVGLFPDISLDYFMDICSEVFQLSADQIEAAILATNVVYGGKAYNGSYVVFVNGKIDPWHALGITEGDSENNSVLFMQETAHCADLYPPRGADPPSLTATRRAIVNTIGQWIDDGNNKK